MTTATILILFYFGFALGAAVALCHYEDADDIGDYGAFTFAGLVWPIWLPVMLIHKLFDKILD